MNNKPAFPSLSVNWDGVYIVIVLLAISGSWLGLLGGLHWSLDLFSHFRWQYLIISFLGVAWAFWKKHRGMKLATLATLLLNAWLIGQPSMAGQRSPSADFHFRVVSLNVLTSNNNHADTLRFLKAANADFIFLMEVDEEWAEALHPLLISHPHHLLQPRQDNFGIALFSRVPLLNVRLMEQFHMPTIQAILTHSGNEFEFIGTHPLPPISALYAHTRDQQLSAISKWVTVSSKPTLLAGDLNATPWSHGMKLPHCAK